jgi:NAD(P)-dependent dehydrogenase (short-subunit alcohol dehydrogenase family)
MSSPTEVPRPRRSALITGASSGIGLAIAHMLHDEGFSLSLVARRPEKLEAARAELEAAGADVLAFAGNLTQESTVIESVSAHRERWGRLDLLVNNAGVGAGSPVGEISTKQLDMQLNTNVRSMILYYREAVDLLRAAAQDRGIARVVNTSSITGIKGEAWLSVYSASKFAVRGFTQSMNAELAGEGVFSTALCPGFVETPMTQFARDGGVAAEAMIRPGDIAEGVRMLLRLSPACLVPEIPFIRPGTDSM